MTEARQKKRRIIPYNPALKERARELRKRMTIGEELLWGELKQDRMCGYDFDRQRPLDEYIVDFYCKDLALAIEVDGKCHENRNGTDKRRQRRLESVGVSFLRFTEREVRKSRHAPAVRQQEAQPALSINPKQLP